jgi:hypothetical protein
MNKEKELGFIGDYAPRLGPANPVPSGHMVTKRPIFNQEGLQKISHGKSASCPFRQTITVL